MRYHSNMALECVKCLLQCRCTLPQFRKMVDPPFHQFVAFVVLEDGIVRPKIVQCNNCGILHRATELCRSDILNGREESSSLISIDDVKACLGESIVNVLESNRVDLPTWEHAQFIVENERWGEHVVLSSEEIEGIVQGKLMRIIGCNIVKVEQFTRNEVF